MNSQLAVDRTSHLSEFRPLDHQPKNGIIRFLARLISYIFHPLFIPVYIAAFLLLEQPWLFASFSKADKVLTLLRFFIMYSFFPLVTVLLTKWLGFLDSIFLKTQKERIIPYIFCNIFYFWMAYVLHNQVLPNGEEFAPIVVQLAMAIFIACSLGLLANITMKVSMHAMSMGILLTFVAVLAFSGSGSYTGYMSIAIFLTGLVCTARLIVSDHSMKEIVLGLLIGFISMLGGVWFHGLVR